MDPIVKREPVDLEARGITLLDGEARNAAHPDTFEIPPLGIRHTCAPGDHVKLGFQIEHDGPNARGERMWVKVIDLDRANRRYLGILDQDPVIVRLVDGDFIAFEPKHILATLER